MQAKRMPRDQPLRAVMIGGMSSIIPWAVDRLADRPRISVRVHSAHFQSGPGSLHYFVKVINLSQRQNIWITHVWFEVHPPVHLLLSERPLPYRLTPGEVWEGWIAADGLPTVPKIEALARVRTSRDKTLRSRLNKDVPPIGYVAGSYIASLDTTSVGITAVPPPDYHQAETPPSPGSGPS